MGGPIFGECARGIAISDFQQDAEFGPCARQGRAIASGRLFHTLAPFGDGGIGRERLWFDGHGRRRGHGWQRNCLQGDGAGGESGQRCRLKSPRRAAGTHAAGTCQRGRDHGSFGWWGRERRGVEDAGRWCGRVFGRGRTPRRGRRNPCRARLRAAWQGRRRRRCTRRRWRGYHGQSLRGTGSSGQGRRALGRSGRGGWRTFQGLTGSEGQHHRCRRSIEQF